MPKIFNYLRITLFLWAWILIYRNNEGGFLTTLVVLLYISLSSSRLTESLSLPAVDRILSLASGSISK